MNYIEASDKYFWHRYTDSYSIAFSKLPEVREVLEFGIFKGNSISWLRNEFPKARILGLDIESQKESWPVDSGIKYLQVDQDDRESLDALFIQENRFYDLVIEDGSHLPLHQFNSLISTIPWMKKGSIYVIEDIHTCLTEMRSSRLIRPAMDRVYLRNYRTLSSLLSKFLLVPRTLFKKIFRPKKKVNVLTILLHLERSIYFGNELPAQEASDILKYGDIEKWELEIISQSIKRIEFVKRTGLPLSCYNCGSVTSLPSLLRCHCGRPLYQDDESMSVILTF
jgi:hypothetical protein